MFDIMSISDFNGLREGTELHYKAGGYGWWIGNEECGPRGGRKINGSLMRRLHQLGIGMGRAQTVASHQTRFFVETKHVDVESLTLGIEALEKTWGEFHIAREYELRSLFNGVGGFRMTSYAFPRCYWAIGRGWDEKAFRFMGYRWVYGRASNLRHMPSFFNRLRLCMAGRDLSAERRAEMMAVVA